MNKKIFLKISDAITLYIDCVFNQFDGIPILFTCSDEHKRLYLCLCTEFRNGEYWTISKINSDILQDLFYRRIDVRSAMLFCKEVVLAKRNSKDNVSINFATIPELKDVDLPQESVTLECDDNASAGEYVNRIVADEFSSLVSSSKVSCTEQQINLPYINTNDKKMQYINQVFIYDGTFQVA